MPRYYELDLTVNPNSPFVRDAVAEFVRCLRAAAPGERVYMPVGDVFKDADVIDLKNWQAARRKAARRKNARRKDSHGIDQGE